MPARIKVDEDLPEDVAELLRSHAIDAISVHSQSWTGRPDEQIWRDLQAESRAMMTADKGFGALAHGTRHPGLVLLRPERESRLAFLELVRKLLDAGVLRELQNRMITVAPTRIRIRRSG